MNIIKKHTTLILLFVIIFIGILRFYYGFTYQKADFHSDEAWSLGLANSYYEPYLHLSDDTSEFKNMNEWISNDIFEDYLTVQDGERFSYKSVYYNLDNDTHPPLYFFILHTICSIFPNQFSLYFGFIINIFAYIILSIFIYKLINLITKSKAMGIISVLYTTFTFGLLCMEMFVRMYMLVATFTLVYVYINAKLFLDDSVRCKKRVFIQLGAISLLSALTDNFYLPFAFVVTLIMCICWIIKKDIKTLLKYVLTMALSIGVSILIFPSTMRNMLGINHTESISTGGSRKMPILYQFKTAIIYINRALFGKDIIDPFYKPYYAYVISILIVLSLLILFLSFLFRNEGWFIKFKEKFISISKKTIHNIALNFNFIVFAMFCAVIFICFIVAYKTDMYGMQLHADRYLFVCYPTAMVLFVLFWWRLFKLIFKKKEKYIPIMLVIILTVSCVLGNLRECHYFMKFDNTVELQDISKDSDFIVISSQSWFITPLAAKLIDCDEVFYSYTEDFNDNYDSINNHELSDNTYILIYASEYSDLDIDYGDPQEANNDISLYSTIKKCKTLTNINTFEYIGDNHLNGFLFKVYKVK